MPLEGDCREILFNSALKSVHSGLSDGCTLDWPCKIENWRCNSLVADLW